MTENIPMTPEQLLRRQVRAHLDKLQDKFDEYKEAGFTVKEIIKFVLLSGMTLAKAVESIDVPGETKSRFLVEELTDLYYKNNLDLPWIPEPFETMLESFIFDNIVPSLVDLLVKEAKEFFDDSRSTN